MVKIGVGFGRPPGIFQSQAGLFLSAGLEGVSI